MQKKILVHVMILSMCLPMFVFAQASTFRDVADLFVQLAKGVVSIIFASLSVAMIYGVVLYFLNADNEKKRTEIKSYLFWGIVGITVVFGLWGILQIMSDSVGWGLVGIPLISPPTS